MRAQLLGASYMLETFLDHAVVIGRACECGSDEMRVRGKDMRISADDRAWESDGFTLCCGRSVGVIRVEADTLFGVREDEAVLNGRPRVYS